MQIGGRALVLLLLAQLGSGCAVGAGLAVTGGLMATGATVGALQERSPTADDNRPASNNPALVPVDHAAVKYPGHPVGGGPDTYGSIATPPPPYRDPRQPPGSSYGVSELPGYPPGEEQAGDYPRRH